MLLQVANQILAHIPDAQMKLEHYAFCSLYVAEEVLKKAAEGAQSIVIQMLDQLAGRPYAAGFRGQLFELYLNTFFWAAGGSTQIATFDSGEQPSFQQLLPQ